MLSVDAALQHVLAQCRPLAPTACAAADALGLVLAEDVTSDVDSPPHDKSLVDGYALIASDLAGGSAELHILEEVTAGRVPSRTVTRGSATRVMTGAPIPNGADAVVMIECSELLGGPGMGRVRLIMEHVASGDNIMRRAASMSRGQTVLRAGSRLRAIELGVLAEVGRAEIRVVERPTVAVLATGNELVRSIEQPAVGQIRNSNGPLLVSAAQAAGAAAVDLGIARDDVRALRERISRGLESDILVISGGVSAGVLDLVPGVLAELGVEQVFHKVNLKPGKPLWFGIVEKAASQNPPSPSMGEGRGEGEGSASNLSTESAVPLTRLAPLATLSHEGRGECAPAGLGPPCSSLVFGLPGNPVSSFVCFELFVRPAIARLAGRRDGGLERTIGELTIDFANRSERPTYHPARLCTAEGKTFIEPLTWQGSGDLRTLVDANALAILEPGPRQYAAGQEVKVLLLS